MGKASWNKQFTRKLKIIFGEKQRKRIEEAVKEDQEQFENQIQAAIIKNKELPLLQIPCVFHRLFTRRLNEGGPAMNLLKFLLLL
ncbi:hypothetical protein [Bartonella florencae]|uniref:hypothetical protein n=1 Tax=Bartonella florencae TaxID=928210 RepID=UPI00055B26AC|nr:hypothetical protein [Bartonella florencae]